MISVQHPTADDGQSEPIEEKPDTATPNDNISMVGGPGSTDPDIPTEVSATQDNTIEGEGIADVSGNEGSDSEGDNSTTSSEANCSPRSRNRHNLRSYKERNAAKCLTLVEQRENKIRGTLVGKKGSTETRKSNQALYKSFLQKKNARSLPKQILMTLKTAAS